MLTKLSTQLLKQSLLSLTSQSKYSFGGHAPVPQSLPKVEQEAISFIVRNVDGQWEKAYGFVGDSFLDVIIRMNVHGVEFWQTCAGCDLIYPPHERPHDPFSAGAFCGKCRIILVDNWFEKIFEQTDGYATIEETVLQTFLGNSENMRLACCVPVEAWMNGVAFEIVRQPSLSEIGQLS